MDCLILDYQTYFPKALSFLVLQKLGKTFGNALDESIYFLAGSSYLHKRTYYSSLVQWSDIFLYLQGQLHIELCNIPIHPDLVTSSDCLLETISRLLLPSNRLITNAQPEMISCFQLI